MKRHTEILLIIICALVFSVFFNLKKEKANDQSIQQNSANAFNKNETNVAAVAKIATSSVPTQTEESTEVITSGQITDDVHKKETALDKCYARLSKSIKADREAVIEFNSRLQQSMISFLGEWYIGNKVAPTSDAPVVQKFFYALSLADLLIRGPTNNKRDIAEALRLLNEVHTADPQNSAPLAFMAVIYSERKNNFEVDRLFTLIESQTTHFDNYVLKINRSIYGLLKTPKDYFFVNDALMITPEPKPDKLLRLIIARKSQTLAKQMMADALNSENNHEGLNWTTGQYVVGCMAFRKISSANKCQSAVQISKVKEAKLNEKRIIPDLEKNCDIQEFETAVEEARKELQRFN